MDGIDSIHKMFLQASPLLLNVDEKQFYETLELILSEQEENPSLDGETVCITR